MGSGYWTQPLIARRRPGNAHAGHARAHGPGVARVTWDHAMAMMNWAPGEHVTLIGPTGRGKTEAAIALLAERHWTVFLSTKRKDATQDALVDSHEWRVVRTPGEIHPDVANRYLFRPLFPKDTTAKGIKAKHHDDFSRVLMRLREQMGWTILLDELHYLADFLGLHDELTLLWLQGRSEGTSLIANTQRPRNVPLVAYSQATHLFFWSTPDLNDVRRIGEFTPLPIQQIIGVLERQDKHDILYVNTTTGQLLQTNTRWS